MNNDLAAKYRNEIMQYYEMRKKKEADLNKSVATNAEPQNITGNAAGRYTERQNRIENNQMNGSGLQNRIENVGSSDSDLNNSAQSIEDRYPEPKLPGYISQPEDYPNNIITGDDYSGIVRAEVTTGERALPVEDAFVIISSSSSGKGKELLGALLTNRSGETIPIAVFTPQAELSTDIPYSVVDIVIYKDGFYSVQNKDVSVYSGTTSILPVNLVPLPASSQPKKFVYEPDIQSQGDNTNQTDQIPMADQTDQMDRMDQMNPADQMDRINQMNQADQMERMNQINQTNQMERMNQINQTNQINRMNQMNQTNRMNRMNRTNWNNRTNQNNNS